MNNIISNNERNLKSSIEVFFKLNKINSIIKQCNFSKEKGIPCCIILKYIFTLVLTGKNLYRTLESSNSSQISKDVVYRFLNSSRFNWRKFLLMLSTSIIKKDIEPLTAEDRTNVLIIDDSLFSRNRSKNVELLARVFDHTIKRYMKGFRLLTLGWSDGNTFVPIAFSLLSSENETNRLYPENKKFHFHFF